MLDAMDAVLEPVEPIQMQRCAKHRCKCSAYPVVPEGVFELHAATPTCVDHSTAGAGWGLLGSHVVTYIAWAWTRYRRREKAIFHECTIAHPTFRLLSRYLGATHIILVFAIDPFEAGEPKRRLRRMAMALCKEFCLLTEPLWPGPMELLRYTRQ